MRMIKSYRRNNERVADEGPSFVEISLVQIGADERDRDQDELLTEMLVAEVVIEGPIGIY